jgi:PTH1 family peptidyl-tRNA hydrolase
MWVIVGLGNPGRRYLRTRHNVGFMVIEEIARRYEIDLTNPSIPPLAKGGKGGLQYRIGRGSIEGEDILLIEPLLYMNRSGLAVKDIVNKFNIQVENLIIIHDDIDMETGKLRIRRRGSSGGHKGIESIIQGIGSSNFIRLKIGIGRDVAVTAEDYVLSRFRKNEVPLIKEAIKKASDAVVSIIVDGVDKAMNIFNKG